MSWKRHEHLFPSVPLVIQFLASFRDLQDAHQLTIRAGYHDTVAALGALCPDGPKPSAAPDIDSKGKYVDGDGNLVSVIDWLLEARKQPWDIIHQLVRDTMDGIPATGPEGKPIPDCFCYFMTAARIMHARRLRRTLQPCEPVEWQKQLSSLKEDSESMTNLFFMLMNLKPRPTLHPCGKAVFGYIAAAHPDRTVRHAATNILKMLSGE